MLTSPVKIYEGAGGGKTNGYFVPTAASFPTRSILGTVGEGEGAPEAPAENVRGTEGQNRAWRVAPREGRGRASGVCSVQ